MFIRISIFFLAAFVLLGQVPKLNQAGGEYRVLRNPQRDPWQKPDQVIQALQLTGSETVAVIEYGYPYFAPRILPYVKKVYSVNTDARAFQGLGTLPAGASPIVATAANPQISGLNADVVLMVDMLRWIPQRPNYFLSLAAGVKPGGRLVVIDRILPPVFPNPITDTMVKAEVPGAGFTLKQQLTLLQFQYFLIFSR